MSQHRSRCHSFVRLDILHWTGTPHLLIHPSVDGHLRCFYFLAILSNAALNILIQTFVWTLLSVVVGTHLGVELRGHITTMLNL